MRSTWEKVLSVVILAGLAAIPLQLTMGQSFVFAYANAYQAAVPFVFLLLLPFSTVLLRRGLKRTPVSQRFSRFGQRFLLFPAAVLIMTAATVYAPYGWSALAGSALGTKAEPVQASVLSLKKIQPSNRRRWLKGERKPYEKAVLDINGTRTSLHIDNYLDGPMPQVGDKVLVYGRSSFLGLYIERVGVQSAP